MPMIIILLEEIPDLHSDLRDRDALIVGLEEEIRELDTELGGASADRSQLIRRLERQARVREQFRQVENMFTSDEAIVLRDGNNLIVRLVGLNFASSSAELGPERRNTAVTKTQAAIEVFPQCALTIEGHTDSQGNTGKNLVLSEERAQAVRTYMTDVMHIPVFRIKASGYGDARPIANNKTSEGTCQEPAYRSDHRAEPRVTVIPGRCNLIPIHPLTRLPGWRRFADWPYTRSICVHSDHRDRGNKSATRSRR